MSPLTKQSLLCLAYFVALALVALVLDGLPFLAASIVVTAVFVIESLSVIRRSWQSQGHARGGETDSAGSGTG